MFVFLAFTVLKNNRNRGKMSDFGSFSIKWPLLVNIIVIFLTFRAILLTLGQRVSPSDHTFGGHTRGSKGGM